ncbi:hypothetical protein T484DRAFT_1877134 [Baffinella frigidus]|nr:hypothetical protein T484DRAFT_1877134 [Cryptophyta sp. CCMP2293]
MLPQARFLPLRFLPPTPQDAVAASKVMAHECLAIRRRIDKEYSTKAALAEGDPSVYTGAAGVAYMYWRLATMDSHYIPGQREELLEKATTYSKAALRLVRPERRGQRRTSTFLTGAAGVYCVAAAIAFTKNETTSAASYCQQVLALGSTCVTPDVPSELLYGRAGFLSCLLFLAANAGLQLKECGDVIAGTIQILADGGDLADADSPLTSQGWKGGSSSPTGRISQTQTSPSCGRGTTPSTSAPRTG